MMWAAVVNKALMDDTSGFLWGSDAAITELKNLLEDEPGLTPARAENGAEDIPPRVYQDLSRRSPAVTEEEELSLMLWLAFPRCVRPSQGDTVSYGPVWGAEVKGQGVGVSVKG